MTAIEDRGGFGSSIDNVGPIEGDVFATNSSSTPEFVADTSQAARSTKEFNRWTESADAMLRKDKFAPANIQVPTNVRIGRGYSKGKDHIVRGEWCKARDGYFEITLHFEEEGEFGSKAGSVSTIVTLAQLLLQVSYPQFAPNNRLFRLAAANIGFDRMKATKPTDQLIAYAESVVAKLGPRPSAAPKIEDPGTKKKSHPDRRVQLVCPGCGSKKDPVRRGFVKGCGDIPCKCGTVLVPDNVDDEDLAPGGVALARAKIAALAKRPAPRTFRTLDEVLKLGVRFPMLLIDPPWPGFGAGAHYHTMSMKELMDMRIQDVATEDAYLYLWRPGSYMRKALELLDAWDFEEITDGLTWKKLNRDGVGTFFGPGSHHRHQLEISILAQRKGGKYQERKSAFEPQMIEAPVREHSRKPDQQYEIIEAMREGPYLEIFGRTPRPGWVTVGYDAEKFAGTFDATKLGVAEDELVS